LLFKDLKKLEELLNSLIGKMPPNKKVIIREYFEPFWAKTNKNIQLKRKEELDTFESLKRIFSKKV